MLSIIFTIKRIPRFAGPQIHICFRISSILHRSSIFSAAFSISFCRLWKVRTMFFEHPGGSWWLAILGFRRISRLVVIFRALPVRVPPPFWFKLQTSTFLVTFLHAQCCVFFCSVFLRIVRAPRFHFGFPFCRNLGASGL